jgi:acylphosphatase
MIAPQAWGSMIAKRVVVHGRVQGVGFRFALVDAARDAGVIGWVRNRHDGSVEAFVQGEASAVERIVDWSKRGPPGARVTECDVTDAPPDAALQEFTQRASA